MKKLPQNLICFSHLRWDFVYQRPQHLLQRFSNIFKTYYWEEPIFDAKDKAYLSLSKPTSNLTIAVPHLPSGLTKTQVNKVLKAMLFNFFENKDVHDFTFWYYTPMALEFSEDLNPGMVIYDCMDELSLFKFAPPELKILEQTLLNKADAVFTGGQSLYEAKKHQHPNIYPFPSSIDKKHFEKGRTNKKQPADQANINGVKIGFYGVIDERFDIELIKGIAIARPEWNIVLLGPVVKIDPTTLPKQSNIHFLGQKGYDELPLYLSGWNIALIPFMLNESTKFISPTKTPEYLSAGVPVVSTAIKDVVSPYGKAGMVSIGSNAKEFVAAIDKYLAIENKKAWLSKVDTFLKDNSWDNTCSAMLNIINNTYKNKNKILKAS